MAITTDSPREPYSSDALPRTIFYPVATNTVIPAGALVCRNAGGYAINGAVATTLKTLGVCQKNVNNNPGANGAKEVEVRRGVFPFKNSTAGDAITIAEIGTDCYVIDNETVAKTDGSAARSIAGKVEFLRDGMVWVRVGI
jgi:hypothetical protein